MLRHIVSAVFFLASLLGCTAQQARVTNAVLSGVACGIAAAQDTPCTPRDVLEALARDEASQRAKVEAVVPQAAAVDPVMAKALAEQLARNSAASEALTKALVELATRGTPLPQYPLTMEPMPPLPPPVAPPKPSAPVIP